MNAEQSLDLSSGRFLNESAIRQHALLCSQNFRAGKFTRVGQDFIDEVKADVEAAVREIRYKAKVREPWTPLEPSDNSCFLTGALCDKLAVEMNYLIGRIIQNKVQHQPSCGCTLGRTR